MKFREYYKENKNLAKCVMELLNCNCWATICGENNNMIYFKDINNRKKIYIFTEEEELNNFIKKIELSDFKIRFIKPKQAILKILDLIDFYGEDFFDLVVFNDCMEVNPLGFRKVFEELLPIYYEEIKKNNNNQSEIRAFYMLPRYYYLKYNGLPLILTIKEEKNMLLFDNEATLIEYIKKYYPDLNYDIGILTGRELLGDQIDKMKLNLHNVIINGDIKFKYDDFKYNELYFLTFDLENK